MQFDPILSQSRIDAMRTAGLWRDRLITDHLDATAAEIPDGVAVTGFNSMTKRTDTLSWRQLRRISDRIALGLSAHGIGKGDVVSFQLPNWWEFVALHLACVRIGAVTNPLMPIFRERELSFMLAFAESRVMIVPRRFRGFDYPAMLERLRSDLPKLEHVFVVGGDGGESFEAWFVRRRWEDECDRDAVFAANRPDPNDVIQLLYTSGTTGEAKGVMHTSNTLTACVHGFVERNGLGRDTVALMASPIAHQSAFLYGVMLCPILGAKLVLQDIWNAEEAARLIQDEGVTYTMGATPFLADLTNSAAVERYDLSSFRTFVSAGAPIPRVLVERATRRLGAFVHSGWGMTENGYVTGTRREDPPEKVFGTDGVPIRGMEVRVVDHDGRPLPAGEEGRLQARGSSNFVGYLKRPDRYDTDAEGWFETGDLARMDADGYIRITGRAKDIIIRGGENIPVVEVEELLYRHPAIQDAAIVGMPDARLGERGCAFVTLKPGARLTFEEMIAFLEEQRMAKQYLPERLEIVEEMPRTASGKIQKFRLREAAKAFAE